MYVKPEAYQAHYRRVSDSRALNMQAQELAAQKQQEQKEWEDAWRERKQADYEHQQYKKLLARHPAPSPPPPPSASLAYNWRSNCNPDGPPLSEDEYQPNYVDPCDPQYRNEDQPLSEPASRPLASKKFSSGSQGDIQIGYDQASDSGPGAEAGC
jgi:hypothetical protein